MNMRTLGASLALMLAVACTPKPADSTPATSIGTAMYGLTAVCETGATLDTDITAATADDVITLTGVSDVLACPEVSMTETWGGGKLIFSDSPESPTGTGALYKDETLGATSGTAYNRVFFYHVNSTGSSKKMAVILKNRSGSSCTLTRQKTGISGPTTSFLYAGKLGYNRWDVSTAASGVSVAAGAWQDLDTTFSGTSVNNGNLYHGIWDYSFPCDHSIITCIRTTGNAVSWCQTASVLARDSHDRGTFDYTEKTYDTATSTTMFTSAGIKQFPIAGDTANDNDVQGWDNAVATPTAEELDGNFGLLYKMHLSVTDDDARHAGFCYNPRAGAWGGAAFVMVGQTPTSGNNHFLLPATTGSESSNTKCVVWGRYDVATDPGTSVWSQFMPTGGSSFPLRLLMIPH